MKIPLKSLAPLKHWRWFVPLAIIVTCGCSGINASKSISPLDFLLPGLHGQSDPAAPATNCVNSVVYASLAEHAN
jgi:hypothetical protein